MVIEHDRIKYYSKNRKTQGIYVLREIIIIFMIFQRSIKIIKPPNSYSWLIKGYKDISVILL